MSLQYIFPDHTARRRHIAIVVEIVMAIAAIVVIVWAVYRYWPNHEKEIPQTESVAERRSRILEKEEPSVILTPDQINNRMTALDQTEQQVYLNSEQVQKRASVLETF